MIERLKDFLYDISDIMVSLLIIAVIFFSVSWKISDTLSFDLDESIDVTTEIIQNDGADSTVIADADEENNETVIDIIPNENEADQSTDDSADMAVSTDDNTAPEQTESSQETTKTPETSLTLNTFTVPSGASGYSIGVALAKSGYVENADAFVSRLVERELDRKLFAGDFKISLQDDMDTIISVLTGQGR